MLHSLAACHQHDETAAPPALLSCPAPSSPCYFSLDTPCCAPLQHAGTSDGTYIGEIFAVAFSFCPAGEADLRA